MKVNLHVLMDDAIVAEVDAYAQANGISRSAALSVLARRAIRALRAEDAAQPKEQTSP